MKIIIYAAGRRLNEWELDGFLSSLLLANNIVVSAVCDGNAQKHGNEICLAKKKFIVKSLEECEAIYDFIVITSTEFYESICEKLISMGHDRNKLVLLDVFIFPFLTGKVHIQKYIDNKEGIEIGGPTDLFAYCYHNCKSCDGVNYSLKTVWWEGGKNYEYHGNILGKMYIAEATDLNEIEKRYDFVLSSNNLEHIANPIKAMKEFMRILKPNGIILLIVPCKDYNFDHDREDTPFEHMLNDFQKETGEDDLTHLPEILIKHDYSLDTACGSEEAFRTRSQNNFTNRCLHHHVFSTDNLKQLCEFFNLEILDFFKAVGNYFLIAKKQ